MTEHILLFESEIDDGLVLAFRDEDIVIRKLLLNRRVDFGGDPALHPPFKKAYFPGTLNKANHGIENRFPDFAFKELEEEIKAKHIENIYRVGAGKVHVGLEVKDGVIG